MSTIPPDPREAQTITPRHKDNAATWRLFVKVLAVALFAFIGLFGWDRWVDNQRADRAEQRTEDNQDDVECSRRLQADALVYLAQDLAGISAFVTDLEQRLSDNPPAPDPEALTIDEARQLMRDSSKQILVATERYQRFSENPDQDCPIPAP